jgi:hypothetical protein
MQAAKAAGRATTKQLVRISQEAWPFTFTLNCHLGKTHSHRSGSMAFSFADFFKSELASSLFASSGSQPLQTELCENPILSRRVITPTFRGACNLSSTSHMPIGIAFNLTLKSYPTRCGCLPNRSRVLAEPQLKRMNQAEGREFWLPGG